MCRSPQRRYAGRNRRVRVCTGTSCHTDRRRRTVLFVIRVEDEQQVEGLGLDRVNFIRLRGNGEHHLQKILRVVEVVLRVHERLADTQLVRRGRNRRQLGDDPVREDITVIRVMDVGSVVIVRRHGADDRRQHCHGMCVVAEAFEEIQHALVEHGVGSNRCIEFFEFALRRQFAVEQQVTDLYEVRVLGKLFDRVSPIHKDAFLAVDKRYVRRTAAGRNETGVVGKNALLLVQGPYVDDVRAGGSLVDG